jgi:hypothetical protein
MRHRLTTLHAADVGVSNSFSLHHSTPAAPVTVAEELVPSPCCSEGMLDTRGCSMRPVSGVRTCAHANASVLAHRKATAAQRVHVRALLAGRRLDGPARA